MACVASTPIPNSSAPAIGKQVAVVVPPAATTVTHGLQSSAATLEYVGSSSSNWGAMMSYADRNPQVAAAIIGGAGSLFVGAVTLAGVAMTLAHAHHRMKRELQAQRDMASEERAYSANQAVQTRLTAMRQDLYLKLIEEYQAAVAVIARLPSVPLSELPATLAQMKDLHASVQKTSLMSETATSDAASEAHSRLNELMFELLPMLSGIRTQADEVAEADAEARRMQATIDAASHRARELQAKKIVSLEYQQNQQLLVRALEDQKVLLERKLTATNRQNELINEYSAKMLPGLQRVGAVAAKFFALARRELGMVSSSEEMEKKVEQTFDRAMSALASLREAVNTRQLGDAPPGQQPRPAEWNT